MTILLIHSCFCVAVPPVVPAIAIRVWDGNHPVCLCNWVSSQMLQSNPEKFHPSNSPGLALLPLLLVFRLAVSLNSVFYDLVPVPLLIYFILKMLLVIQESFLAYII